MGSEVSNAQKENIPRKLIFQFFHENCYFYQNHKDPGKSSIFPSKFFIVRSLKCSLKIGYKCQRNIATTSYTIRPDNLDFRGITCKAEVGEKKITFSSVSGLELEPYQ